MGAAVLRRSTRTHRRRGVRAHSLAVQSVVPSIQASRTTGAAPLYVFFDATATTAQGVAKPFHDLEFDWTFGDAGAGSWTTTGLSRNAATGGCAAHVFESDGEFTVTLTVTDPSGNTASVQETINVTAADTQWATTLTTVVSTGSDFTGKPTDATELTTSTWADITAELTAGRRVLLKRGDTWTVDATTFFNVAGPGMLGAWSSGAKPILSVADTGVISCFSANTSTGTSDWRFVDLDIRNTGETQRSRFLHGEPGTFDNTLMLRCDLTAVDVSDLPYGGHTAASFPDGLAFVETTSNRTQHNNCLFSARRCAVMGCDFQDSNTLGGEHVIRSQLMAKAVMSNTILRGPTGAPRHLWKCNAPDVVLSGADVATEFISVTDSQFLGGSSGTSCIDFGARDNEADESENDIVVERCYVRSGATFNYGIEISVPRVTFKNCIFEGNDQAGSMLVTLRQEGLEDGPSDIVFLGCTGNDDASTPSTIILVNVQDPFDGIQIQNCALAAPNKTTRTIFEDNGNAVTSQTINSNVETNNPDFSTEPPTAPAHYKPLGTSPFSNVGTDVAELYEDHDRVTRPATPDVGAFEI